MTKPDLSNLTPDEAWQRIAGTWTYSLQATNSQSLMKLHFTPDRRMIRSNSLSGGVLPMPMTSETSTPVAKVAVKSDAIQLTLGPNQFGRAGIVVTFRFIAENQIAMDDGVTYTRDA
jgi:hypothetical protein